MNVSLTVPPSIVKQGTVVETKVKETQNITLTCEASGKLYIFLLKKISNVK